MPTRDAWSAYGSGTGPAYGRGCLPPIARVVSEYPECAASSDRGCGCWTDVTVFDKDDPSGQPVV